MDKDELLKIGIKGRRLGVAMLLRSRPYDIMMIILIILYTLLIFVSLALSDFLTDEDG